MMVAWVVAAWLVAIKGVTSFVAPPVAPVLSGVVASSRRLPSVFEVANPEVAEASIKVPDSLPGTPERWVKATKQLATLGPASSTLEMIEALFLAGVDVFRLNFSHGKHEEKAELVKKIREVEDKYKRPIAVLADLQGPKLRVGVFEKDSAKLTKGQKFRFDLDDEPGDADRVQLPHPEIIGTLRVGDTLLVDDGKLRMTVIATGDEFVETTVEVAGTISNRKGVNTPSVVLPISPLTEKDRKDLAFALTLGVDWVALSFVQRPQDIVELRDFVVANSPSSEVSENVKVMAKLEKPAAVADPSLAEIIALCDGIMVARGDLGVEMAPEDVPIIQKRIITECRTQGKPVVVATQMLESMIDSPTPTRAECSDIATAIYDGADAVMLSAESAAGSYPIEAVTMQRRVISRVEADALYRQAQTNNLALVTPEKTATDAITLAARQVVDTVSAKCLCIFTTRGTTVLRAANRRPTAPILALTPQIATARSLSLVWGVYSRVMQVDSEDEFDDVLFDAIAIATNAGYLKQPTDLAVITAGVPFSTPGAANVIRVVPALGPREWPEVLCFPETEECV
ncbi:hypothetical protein CTAYLR_000334 [Chrysophaeum taylorii]|uniref:Pyruvate kinase n=1 Tax=Chrysophaeum taylorii TaxID=2483200 RepID=A0AAD7XPP1_9STRA|nr:hypothetical protein CTAYLR_000334 [Chrysophaeum taylorii]